MAAKMVEGWVNSADQTTTARFFDMLTRALTIPGKVQSYLAAGRPLLGMLDGEGARVIEEAGAGLVCAAGDGAALAERALRLAGMSAGERDAMGLRGQAYGKEQFDRASLMSQLERWLQESGRGATN